MTRGIKCLMEFLKLRKGGTANLIVTSKFKDKSYYYLLFHHSYFDGLQLINNDIIYTARTYDSLFSNQSRKCSFRITTVISSPISPAALTSLARSFLLV